MHAPILFAFCQKIWVTTAAGTLDPGCETSLWFMSTMNAVPQVPGSVTSGSEPFQQTGIKSEPMDYETASGTTDSNGKFLTASPVRNSLNTCLYYKK